MPFTQSTDVSSNGMNYVTLRQVINDYIITLDPDDYVSGVSDAAIRNIALRGIREFGFDVTSRVKSMKLPVESNNTVILPDDYAGLIKVGVSGADGLLRLLRKDNNINFSRRIQQVTDAETGVVADTTSNSQSNTDTPLNIDENLILNRQDSKGSISGATTGDSAYNVFQNYLYQGGLGRLYGSTGYHGSGGFRENLDQNRLELDTGHSTDEVIIEYVSDEARSTNPVIHVYAEEALRSYLYYKLCERKSNVPSNEKARARSEYYNERRKAKARLSGFSKQEALDVIRRNFTLAPKA